MEVTACSRYNRTGLIGVAVIANRTYNSANQFGHVAAPYTAPAIPPTTAPTTAPGAAPTPAAADPTAAPSRAPAAAAVSVVATTHLVFLLVAIIKCPFFSCCLFGSVR